MSNGIKQKIYIFENKDKESFKELPDKNNIGNFICPFRMILCSSPSRGKTCMIKNIILQQSPPFERIIVYHLDETTQEYNDIDCTLITELPDDYSCYNTDLKTLIIFEDIPFEYLSKKDKKKANDLLTYFSTHKNISLIMSTHHPFSISPSFRSKANIMILWKNMNAKPLYEIAQRMNIQRNVIDYIFDNICTGHYDNLCIDNSGSGPTLRKNIFEVISTE